MDHRVMGLKENDENIRQHKTLSEETMLGKITDLAAKCPSGSQTGILPRFFACLFLGFQWQNIAQNGIEEDAR